MATYRDTKYFKLSDTGERTFDYCTRPVINRNDLGPLVKGMHIQVPIMKNGNPLITFDYTVEQDIPEGKVLFAVANFSIVEVNVVTETIPIETIMCRDVIEVREDSPNVFVTDHIIRPRDVRRQNIGPFEIGDSITIPFIVNGNVLSQMDYTVEVVAGEQMKLVGNGSLDFVESNGGQNG
jgi:hypothetical protein